MEDKDSIIHYKQPPISFDSSPYISCCSESFYVFILADNSIQCYDSKTNVRFVLPEPSPKITSRTITSLAVNQAHSTVVAGFDDGSLQFYDLIERKLLKALPKARKGGIIISLFMNDTSYLCYDSMRSISIYRLSQFSAIFSTMVTIKEAFSISVFDDVYNINVPNAYRYIQGQSSTCISQKFKDYVGISTPNLFTIGKITDEFVVVKQFSVSNVIFDFKILNSESMYCAFVGDYKLTIVNSDFKELYTQNLKKKAIFIQFLSNVVLGVVYEDSSCSLIQFSEAKEVIVKLNYNGIFLHGNNSFKIVTYDNVWELGFITFKEKIDSFHNDYRGAIEFCKIGLKKDLFGIVGIPQNPLQKKLFIEEKMSLILENLIKEELKDSNNVLDIINYFYDLSKETLINFLSPNIISIFKENQLKLFLSKILEVDKDAKLFIYTEDLINLIIDNCYDLNISDFLLKIPGINTKTLFDFCLKTKNYDLLANLYLDKLNDPISSMNILANCGNYEKINNLVNLIDEKNQYISEMVIKWLFSSTKINQFHNFRDLMHFNNGKDEFIAKSFDYIAKFEKPFTLEQYLNNLIFIFYLENIPVTSNYYKLLEKILLNSNIKFSNISLKYLLQRIFTNEYIEPDQREPILLVILKSGIKQSMLENLVSFCVKFNFVDAKKYIYTKCSMYDKIIKSVLIEGKENPYLYIENMINNKEISKDSIKKAILSNKLLLIAKDITKFINILLKEFPDIHDEIISDLQDESIKNYYIKVLLDIEPNPKIQLEKYITNFTKFLCIYYPEKIYSLIISHDEINFVEFLEDFRHYSIFNACALISFKIGDMNEFYICLRKYLDFCLMEFVEDRIKDLDDIISFISMFLTKSKSMNYKKLTFIVIESFVIPIYSNKNKEKNRIFPAALHKICCLSIDYLSFEDILRKLIIEFAQLDLTLIRSVLCGIINDYNYDIHTTIALSNLFKNDAISNEEKIILEIISGVKYNNIRCGSCHQLLTNNSGSITIFHCGHVFHCNDQCHPKSICPICNPIYRIDSDNININFEKKILPRQVFRKLRGFEHDIKIQRTNKRVITQKGSIKFIGKSSIS